MHLKPISFPASPLVYTAASGEKQQTWGIQETVREGRKKRGGSGLTVLGGRKGSPFKGLGKSLKMFSNI